MNLISDMQKEAVVRQDRWRFIGAYMAARLEELYGQTMVSHAVLCEQAYHEAARIYENLSDNT